MSKITTTTLWRTIFSYSCTTLVLADGTCAYASFFTPRTHVCCQQGVDGKLISKKCWKNFGGANNHVVAWTSFAKSSNKIKVLKLETQKELLNEHTSLWKSFEIHKFRLQLFFMVALKPKANHEQEDV